MNVKVRLKNRQTQLLFTRNKGSHLNEKEILIFLKEKQKAFFNVEK